MRFYTTSQYIRKDLRLEWLHDVAWAVCWGGSRSTKPCVFPCKVAAAGDERYTSSVRRLRLRSFLSRIVPPMCFATGGCVCVRSSIRFLKLWWQIALEWLHDVAWALCWGGSRSTKPCVFPYKVAAAGDESYLVMRQLRLGSFCARTVPPMCFATSGCVCVRSSMRFLKLWLQIALELLHDVAWAVCWGGSRSTKPCVFPCKVAAAGDESYLGAAVAAGVVLCANCSSYVFCNEWLCLCA